MKKIILLVFTAAILLTFTGCGKTSEQQPPVQSKTQAVEQGQGSEESPTEISKEQSDNGQGIVISKSENKISSEEKEKVLNDISKELDNIIDGLNNLDDISDEDLKF